MSLKTLVEKVKKKVLLIYSKLMKSLSILVITVEPIHLIFSVVHASVIGTVYSFVLVPLYNV